MHALVRTCVPSCFSRVPTSMMEISIPRHASFHEYRAPPIVILRTFWSRSRLLLYALHYSVHVHGWQLWLQSFVTSAIAIEQRAGRWQLAEEATES